LTLIPRPLTTTSPSRVRVCARRVHLDNAVRTTAHGDRHGSPNLQTGRGRSDKQTPCGMKLGPSQPSQRPSQYA